MALKELYTTQEVAVYLTVHKCTVQQWVREGKITPELKLANGWRFTEAEIKRFLEKCK